MCDHEAKNIADMLGVLKGRRQQGGGSRTEALCLGGLPRYRGDVSHRPWRARPLRHRGGAYVGEGLRPYTGRGLAGGQCAAAVLDPPFAPPRGRLGSTMEEYHRHCDEGFNADEAHNIVKECVDDILGGEDYNQNNINQWTAKIVEQSLTHLVKLGKAYKYVVTCAVAQRSAYGFHTASSCFWDTTSDGTCTVRWENRTMNCIVNVFAISIVL
ncbi:dynein light chain Tctex-type 3 [Choloepus didactylus]|uniref:dynein light chain Tctex-type 3 n=1 Tax=Choloepus didactylus TaxID=27675 RepID=UPI00189E26CA|nr:dynein light chain Tctex-type 3 [Choloepus didactylus]